MRQEKCCRMKQDQHKKQWMLFAVMLVCNAVAPAQQQISLQGIESSLGQLCKRSSSVVLGNVSSLTFTNVPTDIGDPTEDIPVATMVLVACSNLYGKAISATNQVLINGSFYADDGEFNPAPEIGQRVLVFVSPVPFDYEKYQAYRWDYTEVFSNSTTWGTSFYAVGDRRGVVVLGHSSDREFVATTARYCAHLRGPARDFNTYAKFLVCAQTSRVERIRRDACLDMRILIRHADIPALHNLRLENILNKEDQEYLAKILSWKEKGEPRVIRDYTPKDEDLVVWTQTLKKGDDMARLTVLAEMIMEQRRTWLVSKSNQWSEVMTTLLADKNSGVRELSAILLARIQDERAMPVMIEMLQNNDVFARSAAWTEL